MSKDINGAIGAMMKQDFPAFSDSYMSSIAREGLKELGDDPYSLNEDEIYKTSLRTISRYFCAWSDDLNKRLAESFTKNLIAYGKKDG